MNHLNPFEHISDDLLAATTKRSYLNEWRKWCNYCAMLGINPLPVDSERFLDFIAQILPYTKYTVIDIAITSAYAAHKYNNLGQLVFSSRLKLLRREGLRKREGIRQAPIMYHSQLMQILDLPQLSARDKALVSLMFDAMLRGGDVLHINWQDIFTQKRGAGQQGYVRIHRRKGKWFAEGNIKVLSAQTMHWLNEYHRTTLTRFKKDRNKIFPVSVRSISKVFEKISKHMGMRFTTHSPRVGATIEMINAGIGEVDIANTADWSSTHMVKMYARNQKADHSGMAKFLGQKKIPSKMKEAPGFVKSYGQDKDESERIA